jgi:hypothetical protein
MKKSRKYNIYFFIIYYMLFKYRYDKEKMFYIGSSYWGTGTGNILHFIGILQNVRFFFYVTVVLFIILYYAYAYVYVSTLTAGQNR